MIPPLLMDVQPHHRVSPFNGIAYALLTPWKCLDMCAAPGSKVCFSVSGDPRCSR